MQVYICMVSLLLWLLILGLSSDSVYNNGDILILGYNYNIELVASYIATLAIDTPKIYVKLHLHIK